MTKDYTTVEGRRKINRYGHAGDNELMAKHGDRIDFKVSRQGKKSRLSWEFSSNQWKWAVELEWVTGVPSRGVVKKAKELIEANLVKVQDQLDEAEEQWLWIEEENAAEVISMILGGEAFRDVKEAQDKLDDVVESMYEEVFELLDTEVFGIDCTGESTCGFHFDFNC